MDYRYDQTTDTVHYEFDKTNSSYGEPLPGLEHLIVVLRDEATNLVTGIRVLNATQAGFGKSES